MAWAFPVPGTYLGQGPGSFRRLPVHRRRHRLERSPTFRLGPEKRLGPGHVPPVWCPVAVQTEAAGAAPDQWMKVHTGQEHGQGRGRGWPSASASGKHTLALRNPPRQGTAVARNACHVLGQVSCEQGATFQVSQIRVVWVVSVCGGGAREGSPATDSYGVRFRYGQNQTRWGSMSRAVKTSLQKISAGWGGGYFWSTSRRPWRCLWAPAPTGAAALWRHRG